MQRGGGLVTSGSLPALLVGMRNPGDPFPRPWMGIAKIGFISAFFDDGVDVELPSRLLGEDLSDYPRVRFRVGSPGVVSEDQGGHILVGTANTFGETVGLVYTYLHGAGRFFYQSRARDLDDRPALWKTLTAGLKWVLLRE